MLCLTQDICWQIGLEHALASSGQASPAAKTHIGSYPKRAGVQAGHCQREFKLWMLHKGSFQLR